MTFVRARRVLIAAASLSALLAVAACGGSKPPTAGGSAGAVDFTKQGDIEYWDGKDKTGVGHKLVDQFNAQHPNGKVTFHELPDSADAQQQQMIQNTQIKNPKMAVLSVDVVWTAQFAANGYLVPLPTDQFPTKDLLAATVDSATYFGKLYAAPISSDGGLLFYRKDLLDKAGITKPPATWDEMKADCTKVQALPEGKGLDCYGGQYQKYEGLTVNFAEAVNSAGGVILDDQGKPNVATPEATKGLTRLVDFFKDGTIPKAAITWQEDGGRFAFQKGKLIFNRNWPGMYSLANKTDGSSQVAGKFDVTPLPGETGPGVSSLGGHNFGIATNAENKGTALDFLKFMVSPETQKTSLLASSNAPTVKALYADPEIIKKFPYMPILQKTIETAKPRPKAVKYSDVTQAIEDAAYGALQGQTAPDAALQTLQSKLQTLTQ
jgi:multiple sugar transport system substrate-binding protein